jgi:hypothetical protein
VVKTIFVASLLLLLAVPALAQDDYPRIQQGMGYANVGVPNGDGTSSRHSGFAMQTDLNLTKMFGIENYFGYFGLASPGCGSSSCYMIANVIGARANYRMDKLTAYGVAGIGSGYYSQAQTLPGYGTVLNGGSMLTGRFGVGVDIPMNDSIMWRVDVSRMSFHMTNLITGNSQWNSGIAITGGIVLNLLY